MSRPLYTVTIDGQPSGLRPPHGSGYWTHDAAVGHIYERGDRGEVRRGAMCQVFCNGELCSEWTFCPPPPARPSTKTGAELIAEVEALASPDALPWERDTSD